MVITEGAVGDLEAAEDHLSWPFVFGDDMVVLGAEQQQNKYDYCDTRNNRACDVAWWRPQRHRNCHLTNLALEQLPPRGPDILSVAC